MPCRRATSWMGTSPSPWWTARSRSARIAYSPFAEIRISGQEGSVPTATEERQGRHRGRLPVATRLDRGAASPRRARASVVPEPRIQPVLEPVAQEVEPEDHRQDREAGKGR